MRRVPRWHDSLSLLGKKRPIQWRRCMPDGRREMYPLDGGPQPEDNRARMPGNIDDAEVHQIVQRVLQQVMGSMELGVAQPSGRKIVAIGADHGGFELKEMLKPELNALGFEILDLGTHSKDAVDYPDFAHAVAQSVSTGKAWRGIMVDGAGIGSCIVANKVPGVRGGIAKHISSPSNS